MFIKTQSYLNFYCSQKLSIQYCIILVQQECNTPCKNLSSKWPDLVYFDLDLFSHFFTEILFFIGGGGQNANLDQTLVQNCGEKRRFFMFEKGFITYWSVIGLQFLILYGPLTGPPVRWEHDIMGQYSGQFLDLWISGYWEIGSLDIWVLGNLILDRDKETQETSS